MASAYPGALDTLDTTWADADTTATAHPNHHIDLGDAVNKIEAELGTLPKASFADVKTRLNAFTTVRKTADQTNTTITPANATDLVFPVVSGIAYTFEFMGAYSSNLQTAGIGLGVTTPTFAAGDLTFAAEIGGFAAAGGAALFTGAANTSGGEIVSTQVAVVSTLYPWRLWGTLVPTASGSIQLRFRAEVAATITLKKACHGRLWTG